MPLSFASVTPGRMILTPMRVTYNGVDLGGTLDNVSVNTEYAKAPIKADQLGDETDLDYVVNGLRVSIVTSLAEAGFKDNWKVAFPNAKLITSGGNKAMYFQSAIGEKDSDLAAQLILHPLGLADADLSGNFLFYKAIPTGVSEVVYGPSEQSRLKVTWRVLPDLGVTPGRWFFHGDPAVGLVSASAAAPVYTGTGNGTITGVTVYNGITKTETITIKCVTAVANGGVFAVSGSLSGALGLATVGIGFAPTSPDPGVISFTLNDGATDFVVNDQFTIATTAANYA